MGGGRTAEREIQEEGPQDGAPGGHGARMMKPLGKLVHTYLLFPPPVPEILAGPRLHVDLEKDRAPDLETPKPTDIGVFFQSFVPGRCRLAKGVDG